MATRNFFITTTVDGRKTDDATGPRAKSGGFSVRVQQRDRGGREDALRVYGYARPDGTLRLVVKDHTGTVIHVHETQR